EYVGRIDEQVKVRGYRIEIGEVEAVLRSHPAVSSCVVIAREEEGGEKRLVGYVVRAEAGEQRAEISEIRRYMGEKLPEYMIPAVFVEIDEMPLTANGKVDRRALPAPTGLRPYMEKDYVAPRTPIEEMVASIWAEVLQVERVGIHDNFF